MWNSMIRGVARLLGRAREEDGQSLAEYAVLTGFIAVVVVAGAMLVGNAVLGLFNQAIGVF